MVTKLGGQLEEPRLAKGLPEDSTMACNCGFQCPPSLNGGWAHLACAVELEGRKGRGQEGCRY
jgi:hypothetical protein